LLDGDLETSSVAMKDNIGCGGQTVWHVTRDWKQNVTFKTVDGSAKLKPPPGTYDCELWLDDAKNKGVCSFAVLENHPRVLFHVLTAWGVDGSIIYLDVFRHDTKHANHPTIHNLVKAVYTCMKKTNLTGVLSSLNHLVFRFDTFPKTDQGKKVCG
jgi:hypothetical protein